MAAINPAPPAPTITASYLWYAIYHLLRPMIPFAEELPIRPCAARRHRREQICNVRPPIIPCQRHLRRELDTMAKPQFAALAGIRWVYFPKFATNASVTHYE